MHALVLVVAFAAATGGDRSDAPRPKRIDVDDDEVVEGGVASAEGERVFLRKQAQFGSLIKLRQSFDRELAKSGE